MSGDVKFIRVNGRVVPIKGKGSAPTGSKISKRYGAKREKPRIKSIGAKDGAVQGTFLGTGLYAAKELYRIGKQSKAVSSAQKSGMRTIGRVAVPSLKMQLKGNLKYGAIGALLGAAIGSVKVTRKGKGESNDQAAKRVSGNAKNKTGV